MPRILIIDDDPDICLLLEKFLRKKNFTTDSAQSGKEGEQLLKQGQYDLVICDFKLPDYNGLEMIKKVNILNPDARVVIITGYSDVKTAVKTLKTGAYDYVTKPLYPDELLITIKSALSQKGVVEKKQGKKTKKDSKPDLVFVKGISQYSKTIQKHIDLIAPTNMTVIISGETGTGKEYVAREIHKRSKRKGQIFEALDCGALPVELAGSELFGHVKGAFTGAIKDKRGSFELANGGTLFLDEIGNLSYDNQIKLLRVLQERIIRRLGSTENIKIDVRLIIATNEDLRAIVKKGKFREDIYYRLNEFKIDLLPIRERKEDIPIFIDHFLSIANRQLNKKVKSVSHDAKECLVNYYWHGNLRELRNVIKRSVLLCKGDEITKSLLPEEITTPETNLSHIPGNGAADDLKSITEQAEKTAILETLEKTGYNKSKAAKLLKIDRKTLYNKLKLYDITD